MIIDSHSHAFPIEAMTDPVSWAKVRGEHHWLRLVSRNGNRPSLQGWANCDDFLRDMDRNQIEKSLLLGWYWENPETCRMHNDYMSAWVQAYPDRFAALASVHPKEGKPEDLLKQIEDGRFLGVGELCPQVQNSSWDDEFWHQLAEWASSGKYVFNLHVTEAVGRDHVGSVSTPLSEIFSYAARYKGVPMILSHWGGGMLFYETNPYVRKRLPNVYYDCAASPLLYDERIFSLALDIVGEKKLLFGSDYPLRLFPGQEKVPDRRHLLEHIRGVGWSPEKQPYFYHGNARGILLNR